MTNTNPNGSNSAQLAAVRDEWKSRLAHLVKEIKRWAEESDWSTRQIVKKVNDSELGAYDVPSLIMQRETTRVLLDPVARTAPGAEGVVDLYLMPAYDDIASLYFVDGDWQLQYAFQPAGSIAKVHAAESKPLTKETLGQVLEEMRSHAA